MYILNISSLNKKIWVLFGVLLSLCLVSVRTISISYARYASGSTSKDSARVAVWDATITDLQHNDVNTYSDLTKFEESEKSTYGIDANYDDKGYVLGGYRFRVSTTTTEAAGLLSVEVKVAETADAANTSSLDKNDAALPESIYAALYKIENPGKNETYSFIEENQTGIFSAIATIPAATAYSEEYIIRFRATGIQEETTFNADVSARVEQID